MNLKFSPIKILIFLSFFISITNAYTYHGVLSRILPPSDFKSSSQVTLLGTGYIKHNNKIYSYTPNNIEPFNAEKSKYTSNSYFKFKGDVPSDIILISPREDTLYCQDINDREKYNWSTTDCLNPGEGPATYSGYFWTKVKIGYYASSSLTYVTTCKANENFNTQTKKCEAPCVKGQSWDQENNKCYIDCTDKAKNMWGYPDGSCMDCSKEKTYIGAAKCICKYFGKKFTPPAKVEGLQPVIGIPIGNGYYRETCDDGTQFDFKSPGEGNDEAPKYDNNSTQIGQDDGNKTKPQDQNASNPSNPKDKNKDKDDNKTSPKDPTTPNQNSNQTVTPANPADPNGSNNGGGSNSGSGGGSNSGSNNNGSSGGGTTIIDNGGSGGGKGNDKTDSYGTFNGKVDYSDLKADADSYMSVLSGSIGDIKSKFDGFAGGLNQFLENVKGNGLSSFQKRAVPDSCAIDRTVSLFGKWSADIKIDLCKFAYILRPIVYYVFYLFLFVSFLILCVKLTIFAF